MSVIPAETAIGATRLRPVPGLTAPESAVWLEVVNDQPAEAFTDVHAPLLELYCRHVVRSRVLANEINAFDPDWLKDNDGIKRYDKLLNMAEREGRAASSLATRLRITRQAIDQQTVARANLKAGRGSKKPWEG